MTQFSVPWAPRREAAYGFLGRALVVLARAVYALAAPILRRFAGLVLIGAVVSVGLLVWIHAIAFAYVDSAILEGSARGGMQTPNPTPPAGPTMFSPSTWGLGPSQIHQLDVAHGGGAASVAGV